MQEKMITMGGTVWQGPASGPGRELRAPQLRVVRDPSRYPGSAGLDRALAGDQPAIQRQPGHSAEVTPPGLYPGPARGDIRRDRKTGGAQLATTGGRQQHRGTASSVPVEPPTAERELSTEKNPPHQPGFRVVRDHGGGAQTVAVHTDRGVVDYLGSQYFRDGESDPPVGPLCAYCFKPFTPSTRGGRKHQKYCSAPCRKKGSAANLAAASKIT